MADLPILEGHERLVTFQGDLAGFTFDAKGNLKLTVIVAADDKWLVLPMTDIRGRRFVFDVHVREARAGRLRAKMRAVPVPAGVKSLRDQWVDEGD